MTLEERKYNFIQKAKEVHLNENLDYSLVEYVNTHTPVIIIDHDLDENGIEYGKYKQTPSNHLKGQSHPRKRGNKIAKKESNKQEDIIRRFKEAHPNENLDYSEVQYVNMHTRVKIISHDLRPDGTEYGEFWQEPIVHLKGCSHPDKAKDVNNERKRYTTDDFIHLARLNPENKDYSYEKVKYVNSKTKVLITCNKIGYNGKIHGDFEIPPDAFLQGKGCPKCGNQESKDEDEIYEYITSIIGENKVLKHNTSILGGMELDIYIPSKNIAIEYDGLRWHSELFKDKDYHLNKTLKCQEKGISLIHIFEDEYHFKRDIVLEKLTHILGYDKDKINIGARKTVIREINKQCASEFLEKYHIQGSVSSTIYLGSFYNDKLIAVMTFLKEKEGKWNLNRYVTDTHYNCQGVASKLFKYFIKRYTPIEVKSFLDRRWCVNENNNLYTKLGFIYTNNLKPDYHYTDGHYQRLHKFGFRKKILSKKYGFPLTMTEREMVKELKYYRIYDCGLIKYVWQQKNQP